jgi:histidinol-phosphatase
VYPSQGNYIFIQTKKEMYEIIKNAFEENKIALRYYPALNNGIRITIGKPAQNRKVLAVLDAVINKKKYAFIDRDGTLIFEPQDTYQIDNIEKLQILDGAISGLKELMRQKYELIMITNQDGLGTASFPEENFKEPQNKMLALFKKEGITFKHIFICPHVPLENCICRKPKLGLVTELLARNNVDKKNSFVCGDRSTDKQLAENLGVIFVPVETNGNFYEALVQRGIMGVK